MPEPQEAVTGRAADLATEAADRAAHLQSLVTARAVGLANEQAASEASLAYERGRRDARVDENLKDHGRQLGSLSDLVTRQANATEALKISFATLAESITAASGAATDAANKSLSARQFYVGLIAALAAVGLLMATLGNVIN